MRMGEAAQALGALSKARYHGWRAASALLVLFLVGCGSMALPVGAGRSAWRQPPPPVRDAPVVAPGRLRRLVLENGLHLLVLEDHRLPRVSMGVSVRHGAADVDVEHAGLASFTAELMNRGAGGRDAMALARAVDEIGASLGVAAGWDSMRVSVTGLSRDLDVLLGILRDVVLAPRFDPVEAEKARAEQLASLQAALDDSATLARWGAMKVLYEGHRYGLALDGAPETVAAFDAGSARALYRRFFLPNDAILYVSGDVDGETWIRRAREIFGDWPRGEIAPPGPPASAPRPAASRVVIVDDPDLVQARILIGHEGIDRTDPRRIAAVLMNDTLGGSGFSSRMMKTLRSDAGLTYGVGSGFVLRRRAGPFLVSTFTRVAEVRRAIEILMAEIEHIRSDRPPTEKELADAKSYSVGHFALGLETSEAVMGSLVDLDVHGLPEDSLDTYRARVRAVTPKQVIEVARELLHPERAAIVLLGPAEKLAPQLEGLGVAVEVRRDR